MFLNLFLTFILHQTQDLNYSQTQLNNFREQQICVQIFESKFGKPNIQLGNSVYVWSQTNPEIKIKNLEVTIRYKTEPELKSEPTIIENNETIINIETGNVSVHKSKRGACSHHGGIDKSAGADEDGSVICKDGTTNSSVQN